MTRTQNPVARLVIYAILIMFTVYNVMPFA